MVNTASGHGSWDPSCDLEASMEAPLRGAIAPTIFTINLMFVDTFAFAIYRPKRLSARGVPQGGFLSPMHVNGCADQSACVQSAQAPEESLPNEITTLQQHNWIPLQRT